MKVHIVHYLYFWFVNTLMATALGFFIGYAASPLVISIFATINGPPELLFAIPVGFIFVSQIIIASCFWGKRRGEFEYSFLEKTAMKKRHNPEISEQLKEIKLELKSGGVNSAHEKLMAATKAFPDNFVAHFMFALSCERMGLAEAAIDSYETARKLLPESAQILNIYVTKQISRVKSEGPSKISTAPGLQYLMW
jgi:hypothetical protein